MNPHFRTVIIVLVTLVAGFTLGRGHAIMNRGYFYEIRDKKVFDSPEGPLEWRYVTKSVGLPFLTPGATELEYRGRILYSADIIFQENYPFARDVVFDGRTITWNDGELSFSLSIKSTENKPNKAMETTPVDVTIPAAQEVAPSTSVSHL